MAKFSEFTDTFDNGVRTSRWPRRGQNVSWDAANKAAVLNINTDYSGGIDTAPNVYDFTGSAIYFKLTFGPITSTFEVYCALTLDANNYIQMFVSSNSFSCQKVVAGTITNALSTPYIPSQHGPWWRMREASGTVYFDVSGDGINWVNMASTPDPTWSLTALSFSIYCGSADTTPGPSNLIVDNVNVVPYPTTALPVWARLTGPKGDRAVPSYFRSIDSAPVALTAPHVRYDTSWTDARVYRTWQGICFLEGLIRRSDNGNIPGGTTVGNIPLGYWPAANSQVLLFASVNGDATLCMGRLDVTMSGALVFQATNAASGSAWLSLCGYWPVDPTWHA